MDSKWNLNADILSDIRFAVNGMKNKIIPRKPKRIECTEEIYERILSDIWSRLNSYNELIFPCGNPFDIIFVQTDFSKWNDEDMGKGYKVLY